MNKGIAFSRFHPITLFCYFACLLLFTMFTQNPVLLALSLLGSLLFNLFTSTAKERLRDLKFYAPVFLLVALTNPLFSHNGATPLFFMNDNPVTLEAILCGVNIAMMLTAVMLACKSFGKVMESDKLLALFGKISPRLSVLLSMSLRFIPLMKRKWAEIRDAQAAVGYFRDDSIFSRFVSYARVFSSLVGWSLENAADTASSMSARGYELKGKKHFSLFRFTKGDGAFLCATLVLSALTLTGFLFGRTDFAFYPIISEINTDLLALITYSAFAVLVFMPFIFEVKEAIKWKYLRSKI